MTMNESSNLLISGPQMQHLCQLLLDREIVVTNLQRKQRLTVSVFWLRL